jgi:hypothetical protein
MLLTHPKIATLRPDWAPFAGWSLIFRGNPVQTSGAGVFAPDPATLAVFDEVAQVLEAAGPDRLMRDLLLCLLPPDSYHVTFADLIHQGQLARATGPVHDSLSQALACAEGTVPAVLTGLTAGGMGAEGMQTGDFCLRITGLTHLGGSVVALALEPEAAEHAPWPAALAWRAGVVRRLEAETGLAAPAFRPHLTLGYFANPALAATHRAGLTRLSDLVGARLTGRVLRWQAVGLYRFTSMVAFQPWGAQTS